MYFDLPLDQLRFNFLLRILITIYGISGVWNLLAFIPGWSEEDAEILWCKHECNYMSQLISSILYFLLWISLFRYPWLIAISVIEVYCLIVIYLWLIIKKWIFFKKNKARYKKINKKRYDEFTGKAY